jgi:iron complex transport system ATP-binding protein
VIRAVDVRVALDGRPVLAGIDLEVRPGELVAVIGANGAGKSTFLRACAGLLPCPGVTLDGVPVAAMPAAARARRIAWLGQRSPLDAGFLVAAVVAQGRYAAGPDPTAVAAAMERCGIAELAERRFDHLSGGERQRVLLARALAQGADHLLADEPTAHLDPAAAVRIHAVLAATARAGAAVLVATHDLGWARQADRVMILVDGRCSALEAGADLTPAQVEAAFQVRLRTDGWRAVEVADER